MVRPLPKIWSALVAVALCGCGDAELTAHVDDTDSVGEVQIQPLEQPLEDAVAKNLRRVEHDIDVGHLDHYGLNGPQWLRFRTALWVEFGDRYEDIQRRRMEVLASIAFVRAPELLPPSFGRKMPFHGMDEAAYKRLINIEDRVFNKLVSLNGGRKGGVPPFSVCETKYMIEHHVNDPTSPLATAWTMDSAMWEAYRTGYTAYAASCPKADLDEWYNFRGLGKLRPTWLESNLMDRFTRRLRSMCRWKHWDSECQGFFGDPLPYRDWRAQDVSRRFLHYAPDQEATLANPNSDVLLVPDRDGDGVGELVTPKSTWTDANGQTQQVTLTSTGKFSGTLNTEPWRINLTTAVHPDYRPQVDLARPDMGLTRFLPEGSCKDPNPTPENCPLLKRLYVLVDRHVDFYNTYTNLDWDDHWIGKQPSPLVACSVTLGAADDWARMSPSGTDGFVYVMRVPFRDIVAGRAMSSSTLATPPHVTTLPDIYNGKAQLDFTRAWLDIATLSNNIYAHEHEISKYGWVRTEQIEGIIYVGTPADVP